MQRRAFTLVEVTLALGIIAFALIAVLGLLPVGTKSGAEAIDATRIGLIEKDVQARAKASVSYTLFSSTSDSALPTSFYDREGNYLGTTVTGTSVYRVDGVIHGNWGSSAPSNVDATVLRPVTVQITWPVNTSNGSALGNNSASIVFYVHRP